MDDRDGTALGLADVLLERLSPPEREVLDVLGPSMVESDGHSRSDGALGFGVTEIAWLSVVIPVAKPVVDYLLEVGKDVLTDLAKDRLSGWLDSLRGRTSASAPAVPPSLPPELAAQAGEVAYRHAVTLGLPEDRAQLLRGAVTGTLVGSVR